MASLKLSALSKVYPSGETALYDINLEARDKEFLVIVGGEKSGKSTLLRIVAGLEDATDGSLVIDGKDMTDVEPKDRNIAMVFKASTLYPALSVYDNIAFGLKLRKAPQSLIDQRVRTVAELLSLTSVLFRKPKALTAAAKQRVALARAIVREPALYLFDEPLSGLDESLRADLLNVIVNMQARVSGTFVYATKSVSEALAIGTRIVVLKQGLVQQIDTPANLYDYPANAYVAFFFGSPTINFLQDTSIVKDGDGYAAAFKGGRIKLGERTVSRFSKISEYADTDKKVILGLRPEDAECDKGGEIKGKVGGVEEKDGKCFAECNLGSGNSIIVGGQTGLLRGEETGVKVDTDRLYIFDSETRLTLLERDGGYEKTDFVEADFVPLAYADELAAVEKLKPQKDKAKKGKK